jgi:hypothetical protein
MFKDNSAIRSSSIIAPAPATATKSITEDELDGILDRLQATRDIFRQNQEMRDVLSRREADARALQTRNAELEEVLRRFTPMLLNVATSMGLAVKNEKPEANGQPRELPARI